MTDHPQFVMSMYANKTDLLRARSEYYMEETERLEESLAYNISALSSILGCCN